MSTPSVADIIRAHGVAAGDIQETVREVESVKAIRFAWHPWMNLDNFGPDTFRFNVPYAVLPRLDPIPLWTVPRPFIHSRQQGSLGMLGVSTYVGTGEYNPEGVRGYGDSSGFGGSVPSGAGARVTRIPQKPAESVKDLLQAWGKVGMTELVSLAAVDEAELVLSYDLYEAVAGEAKNEEEEEAGRRPAGMPLEDFLFTPYLAPFGLPSRSWLEQGAPRALEYALRLKKIPKSYESAGLQLISELTDGVSRAHAFALDPANGQLPKTRKLMQIAKQGGGEGKTHFDEQDLWMMREFPSFPMDTEVDRAQRALSEAVSEGNRDQTGMATAVLALAEEMREGRKQTDEILKLALKNTKGE
jgi:hypothetical protein